MTAKDIDQIKERLSKTTPGKWTPYIEGRDFTSGSSFVMIEDGDTRREDIEFIGASPEDIDFIGHAKGDIARLIEEIEKLKSK